MKQTLNSVPSTSLHLLETIDEEILLTVSSMKNGTYSQVEYPINFGNLLYLLFHGTAILKKHQKIPLLLEELEKDLVGVALAEGEEI